MSREDRRKRMDPTDVETIRARLARIRVAIMGKRVKELRDQWTETSPIERDLFGVPTVRKPKPR